MNVKKVLGIMFVLFISLFIVACSNESDNESEGTNDAEATEETNDAEANEENGSEEAEENVVPEDEALFLFNRSSNPKKKGLIILNGVGVVDSDYYNNADNEGELAFVFYNMLNEDVTLEAGEKLGQGIFMKYAKVDNDTAEAERTGGFGSTGK